MYGFTYYNITYVINTYISTQDIFRQKQCRIKNAVAKIRGHSVQKEPQIGRGESWNLGSKKTIIPPGTSGETLECFEPDIGLQRREIAVKFVKTTWTTIHKWYHKQ